MRFGFIPIIGLWAVCLLPGQQPVEAPQNPPVQNAPISPEAAADSATDTDGPDDAVLEHPEKVVGEAVTIPDPAALVADVEKHQRALDEYRETFTFHEIQEVAGFDAKGRKSPAETEEREIFFVNKHRIVRLVKKQGVDISDKEKEDQDQRVRREVENAVKHPRERGGGIELSALLPVMTVSNPRRVTLNGRATLAFDFDGDPDAKARGMRLSAARKMSGTIWIDEADRAVAKMEATFDENFSIAGGLLATIEKGSFLRMEQTHVGQGLWLPSATDLHLVARAFIFRGLRRNIHTKDFDFQHFETSATGKVAPPTPEPQQ